MYEDVIYALWYFWWTDFWAVQRACEYFVDGYGYVDDDYDFVTDSVRVWLVYRGSSFSFY